MDVKKSPKANLEKSKVFFTLIGFVMVLSMLFIALEWSRSKVPIYSDSGVSNIDFDDVDMPQTREQVNVPPPPPPPPVSIVEFVAVDNTAATVDPDFSSEINKNDIEPVKPSAQVIDFTDDSDVEFVVVEQMPEFIGNVFEFLSKHINYPQNAVDNQIQGKVICQFIVNKDGSIVDVVVVRGVHPSLDAEAVRVVKTMPKWKPGLQRGKAVRVKYTLPISFKLMM